MARVEITESVLEPQGRLLVKVDGASVQVNVRGGGAATVYTAATGGTTRTQPLTTRNGRVEPQELAGGEAWLEEGSYDFVVSYAGQVWTQRWEAYSGIDGARLLAAESGIAAVEPGVAAPRAGRIASTQDTRISIFAAGHGAVSSGGTGTLSDDTADFVLGSQSLKVVTDGAGGASRYEKTFSSTDLSTRQIKFLIKLDKTLKTEINNIAVYAQSGGTWANFFLCNSIDNPSSGARTIHHLANEWAMVTLNRGDFTATGAPSWTTITAIRVTLIDTGGTIVTGHHNLIGHQADPANGVISLTFDDGWASIYTLARAKMDAYGFAGTHYTIKETIGTAGYMTLAQLKALQNVAGWEIASHAYTLSMHNSALGYVDFTDAAVEDDLRLMKLWLQDNGLRGADHFAWPKGQFDAAKLAVGRKLFTSMRGTHSQTTETYPPGDPERLRIVNGGDLASTLVQLQAAVDEVKNTKAWGIFMFHDIVTTPSGANQGIQTATATFNSLIDYINTQGVRVKTVGEVLRAGVA